MYILALCLVGTAAGATPSAWASCAQPPAVSQHVFAGTVTSTERDGRIARVRTDDGQDVEVDGTPSATGGTSVDRTYAVGTRYEFHPLNATSPFQDNACTSTRPLPSQVTASASLAMAPGTPMARSSTGSVAWPGLPWLVGGVAAAMLLAGIVIARARRGRAFSSK